MEVKCGNFRTIAVVAAAFSRRPTQLESLSSFYSLRPRLEILIAVLLILFDTVQGECLAGVKKIQYIYISVLWKNNKKTSRSMSINSNRSHHENVRKLTLSCFHSWKYVQVGELERPKVAENGFEIPEKSQQQIITDNELENCRKMSKNFTLLKFFLKPCSTSSFCETKFNGTQVIWNEKFPSGNKVAQTKMKWIAETKGNVKPFTPIYQPFLHCQTKKSRDKAWKRAEKNSIKTDNHPLRMNINCGPPSPYFSHQLCVRLKRAPCNSRRWKSSKIF